MTHRVVYDANSDIAKAASAASGKDLREISMLVEKATHSRYSLSISLSLSLLRTKFFNIKIHRA